ACPGGITAQKQKPAHPAARRHCLGGVHAREYFRSRRGASRADRGDAHRRDGRGRRREARRARGRQLRLQEHHAAGQSVERREPDGGDAAFARLHAGRGAGPARSRQGRDGHRRAEFRPAGPGRRCRAVLLCRPRRAGRRLQLPRA
ncbi:hypothetical protein KXW38_001880, partial [Aspergillus fumigatus]